MFRIEGFFNPYLAVGQNRLDVVLTVTSDAAVAGAAAAGEGRGITKRVVGFVVDVSGSMKGEKLSQAKLAARRGLDILDQEAWFFVVTFSASARTVVRACQATEANVAAAHHAIQALDIEGATAMSTGLEQAWGEVKACGPAIASVYFLTDGQNDRGDSVRLPGVIDQCHGVFQCDCRGVGTDWKPDEIRLIAAGLLGNADAISNPAGIETDFRDFLARSMSKAIAGATLRIWSPKVVKVALAKQMSPDMLDLMPVARRIDEKTLDIPLGAWGTEARDYQLAFEMPPGTIGDEILACRASVVFKGPAGEVKVPCDPIAVKWSDDDALTTRISREVAHYTGQAELADAIQEGLEAKARGDEDQATRQLGRAAQLADHSGNEEITRRLRKVVDIVDAEAGTVRLRKADKAAEMELDLGATRTVRRRAGVARQTPPADVQP